VEFPQGKLPTIYTALTISNPAISDEADNRSHRSSQHFGPTRRDATIAMGRHRTAWCGACL